MKRKLLILLAVTLGSILPASAQQWAYRAPITISNPSGSAVTNFQVLVSLGSSFNFAGALSNGSDLRFTASDGATLLPFWIQNWNPSGETATIWVLVPTLPTTGTTIYLYYGNPNPPTPAAITLDTPPMGPFTKSTANPIVPIGDSGDGQNLLAEDAVYDPVTGHYWMVFSDYRDLSLDLVWSNTPSNPASWNWTTANPMVTNAQSPHLMYSGGVWYIFYGNLANNDVSYATATSVTGPYSGPTNVLAPGTGWEKERVLEPYVFQRADGKWILVYMGDSGNTTEQVGYATANSIAGPYTKYSGNPVIPFGASGTYDAGTTADPWVVAYTAPGTTTVTYYIGYAASSTNVTPWQTAYASTTDWVNFTKYGILLPLSRTGWDSDNSFRGATIRVGNTYVLSYTGDDYEMGIATQPAVISTPSIINNPNAVFEFFDGFSGTSLNTATWMVNTYDNGGTATVSGNQLTLDAKTGGSIQLEATPAFSTGNIMEVMGEHLDAANSPNAAFETGFDGVDSAHIASLQDYPNASQLSANAVYNGSSTGYVSMDMSANANFHTYQIYRAPNGTAQFLVDGTLGATLGPTDVPLGNLEPWLMSMADSSASQSRFVADWVRVRKYLGTDALSTVGSQQTISGGTSLLSVSSVTLNPSTVGGGSNLTGTVTLTGNAPTGGAVVDLYSGTTSVATVPASVTVAAGHSTATFTVITTSVADSVSVFIDAFYNSTSAQATLTVASAGLAIGLDPMSVVGTTTSTGTVTLGSPAVSGGASVALSSSNTAVATVPSSVTVPAGAQTNTFTVSTSAVGATATPSITATYASYQASATLTVNAPDLVSVTLNPTSVTGGTSSAGTVMLDYPAPTGGALVTLSSNSISAGVPANVTVLAGATTATFTVTTSTVSAVTTATISGSYSGSGTLASGTLTVNPPAIASVALNPTTVVGGLANSTGTLTLNGAAPSGGIEVSLSSNNAAASVPANVNVTAGATTATFTVTTGPVNVLTGPVITATLNGTATASLTVNPPSVTSLTLNPTTVIGGLNNSIGTVTLNTAAPTGGIPITLSSSIPAVASVPSNVTVLAGATTATFTITTSVVNAVNSPVINAKFVDSARMTYGSANATLTVNPITISTVTLNPTSVIGGQANATGTVTLVLPALAGGATVTLSSSNASAVVPTSVFIAAGSATATFNVTSMSVSASTPTTITGTFNGTASANLTVNPPSVSSLSLSPNSVTGGASSTGTVTLNAQAPAGGAIVSLSSNNGAATVPGSVIVPQGATNATFTFTSNPVSSVVSSIITASYSGTQTATLTVNPPVMATINLNPSYVIGGVTLTGTVTLTAPAPAGGISVSLSSDNTAAATVPPSVTVAAGQTTSAPFNITTTVVSVTALANISGNFGGTKSAPLTLYPFLSLASIAVPPTVATGGSPLTGTLTLTNPAPAGGAVVTLTANNTSVATVDPSATVAAGQTSATFGVYTNQMTSAAAVTVTGSYNGNQSTTLILTPAGVSPTTVWPSTEVPITLDSGTTTPGEFGVEFYSDTNGYILGIRFYKGSPQNSGTHVGNLWSASGQLLASATFTNETPSGWQQVLFSNPVQISANTTYVASYYDPTGDYSNTETYFALGFGSDNPPLHVLGDGPTTPNGVFSYGTTSTFPTSTFDSTNYYADVLFIPTPTSLTITTPNLPDGFQTGSYSTSLGASGGTQPYNWSITSGNFPTGLTLAPNGLISGVATESGYFDFTIQVTDSETPPQSLSELVALYIAPTSNCPCTIWPTTATPQFPDPGLSTPGEFGVRFHSDSDGYVQAIRFYKGAGNTGTHVGNLWTSDGQILGSVTFTNETSSGWQQATFATPVHITANTEYIASYYNPTGDVSYTSAYFALGASSDNPPLHAPADSSSTPDGIFTYGPSSAFPTSTNNSTNYFVDILFNAVPGPLLTSLSMNPASVIGGTSTTGTVTISAPAATGGETITLSSNDQESVIVPNTVVVPAGATSATFTANTSPTPMNWTYQVTATGNGTQTADVLLTPPLLQSVSVNPTTIDSGYTANGTVTLNVPAPIGGWLVSLSSNNAAATVPASITIPEGSTSSTFEINTSAVGSRTAVTISAIAGTTLTTTLTVNPFTLAIESLSLNPTTVGGGTSSTGTVVLNGPAQVGGTVVTLSSSGPSATVPGSVTVLAGSSSATFTATTVAVGTVTQVTISATAGGTKTSILTVNPGTILSVTLNPTSVVGGSTNSTGTVTLNGPAPGGGLAITLSSSNTSAATVAGSVTVPAGSTSANFTVTSVPVSSQQTTSIIASLNGGQQSATLTVNPPSPASVTFNPTSVTGGTSTTGTVTLTAPAPVGGLTVALSSNNAAAGITSPVTVLAGFTTANFTVTTTPVGSIATPTITATLNGTATGQFTINPPAVSSVTLNPTSVIGGISSTGTVHLNTAAPTGGLNVSLSSNNTAAATVPASVTVASGATTATFTVTSIPVSAQATPSISATFNGGTQSATLTVNPPTLSSLTLNPTTVTHPAPSTGTITISGAAPTGGFVVTLSSSNTTVGTVPATATVAAGATTVQFTVTTLKAGTITISASKTGSTTRKATLTVH